MTQSPVPTDRWPVGDVPAGRPYLDTALPPRPACPHTALLTLLYRSPITLDLNPTRRMNLFHLHHES